MNEGIKKMKMEIRRPASSGCGTSQLFLGCVLSIWMLFSVVVANSISWPHHQGSSQNLYGVHHPQRSKQGLHQYHPLKTPLNSLQVWGSKVPLHHEADRITNDVMYNPHRRYEKQHTKQDKEIKDNSHLEPNYHHEKAMASRSVTNTNSGWEEVIHSVVIEGTFGVSIVEKINRTSEYLFEFIYNATELKTSAVRVTVSSPMSGYIYPLLVVVRQQRGVLSWQLPLEPPPNTLIVEEYYTASHTLCPVKNYKLSSQGNLDTTQRLFVDVSTSSPTDLNFTVTADFEREFLIELHNSRVFEVTPSQPVFYEFKFPEKVDMVLVKVNAKDDFCAMVAIQNITCPVFDSEENVQYGNAYQTMTYQAGITVRKVDYPNGFYIVVVMLSTDEVCSSSFRHVYHTRKKTVTIAVEEKITKLEYLAAIIAGLGFCAFFYIVTLILACISYVRAKRKHPRERSLLDDSILGSPEDLSSPGPSPSYGAIGANAEIYIKEDHPPLPSTASDSSLDEDDIDMLTDAESDKDIFRTKTFLYVSDLARKDMRILTKKSQLYIWGLLTIGVFYAVPVIQLVITYQRVLDDTGNQDLCFYNFRCAHPLGPLSDFNHVFSNISYILFGILFVGVCARRNHHHKVAVQADYKIDKV